MSEPNEGGARLDYVGLKPCGCLSVWTAGDQPEDVLEQDVGRMMLRGLGVQRVTADDAFALATASRCSHRPTEATPGSPPLRPKQFQPPSTGGE